MPNSNSVGDILHVAGVRLRVTGSGNLKMSMRSLDDEVVVNLVPTAMLATTSKEPFTLTNYLNQRGQLKVGTTSFDNYFVISKMVIFTKPIYSGYPQ